MLRRPQPCARRAPLAEAGRPRPIHAVQRVQVSTDVTLVFVPSGALQGPMNILLLIGGVSPRGPHRDKH